MEIMYKRILDIWFVDRVEQHCTVHIRLYKRQIVRLLADRSFDDAEICINIRIFGGGETIPFQGTIRMNRGDHVVILHTLLGDIVFLQQRVWNVCAVVILCDFLLHIGTRAS